MMKVGRWVLPLALVFGVTLVSAATAAASCPLSLAINGAERPCALAQVADTFGTTWSRSWLWSGARLTGRLLNSAGSPSVGTLVSVSQANLDGSGAVVDAQTTTDANGRYVLTVGRGLSRVLTVTAAGNSQEVMEAVAPNVSLHLASRRHRVLVLSGTVFAGGLLPTVVLQVRIPAFAGTRAHWQVFATAAVDGGRYRTTYDAPPGSVPRFKVRATTMATPPLLVSGASGTHWAIVRR